MRDRLESLAVRRERSLEDNLVVDNLDNRAEQLDNRLEPWGNREGTASLDVSLRGMLPLVQVVEAAEPR